MSVRNEKNKMDDIKNAWRDANLAPLWETSASHAPQAAPDAPSLWPWSVVRPLIEQAVCVVSPKDVERRVLALTNPKSNLTGSPYDRGTTRTINTGLQILAPGESARPHRHSMNALRFVLAGEGAITTINGKQCMMEEGDLILTPGWCWHEHAHSGSAPIVWLDVLDSPLHRYLGTAVFERGPITKFPDLPDDAAFASPNIVPQVSGEASDHSPVFRYPYRDAATAVALAPLGRDNARRVRYANPLTGGASLATIDSCLLQLDAGSSTMAFRTNSNAICAVVEGSGESTIGETEIKWGEKDVFTIPQNSWATHRAKSVSRLFVISDREIFARLGLLKEEYSGN